MLKRKPLIELYDWSSEHGRSTKMVKCPFCGEEVEVYIWSFAGSGKRCSCGALLRNKECIKEVENE